MDELALVAIPLAALAFLTIAGAGLAAVLAPRLPLDAQAALAPVVTAAAIAVASVLLPLGAPPLAVAIVVAAAALLAAAVRGRAVVRAAAAPAAIAVLAAGLAVAPAVARGDGRATSLYGSTDAYHWVSQARAYLDGPAAAPAVVHPDRLTYERSREQHWAVAVPFALLQLAWVTGEDPVDLYAPLAAVLFALLPLATYAAARGCFGWERGAAAAAAALVAANAVLLFASHFSWQQQVAGTAFAFAAAVTLRLGLEPEAPRRELALAALLAAAALATYRLGFAPYAVALTAATIFAYGARNRLLLAPASARIPDRGARDSLLLALLARVGVFATFAVALSAPSLVALGRGLAGFVESGGFSTAFKRAFPDGHPAEALGLVPRVWALQEEWPAAARLAWVALATVAAVVLVAAGARAARRLPRADFLVAGAVLTLGGYAVLLVPAFASYLSFKILAYGAPFLVLLVAAARPAARIVAAALVVPSAIVATVLASSASRPAPELAAPPLPEETLVSVEIADPWAQAWALYRLREQRLSVEEPSFILTRQGLTIAPEAYRRAGARYRAVAAGDAIRVVPAP